MSDSASIPPVPSQPRRHNLTKYLVLGICSLLAITGLMGACAWYLTTDAGIRQFVLPWISKKTGVEIRAVHATWKPMSSLQLEGLRMGPAQAPILTTARLLVDYQGQELWNRRLVVDRLVLDSPKFHFRKTSAPESSSAPSRDESSLPFSAAKIGLKPVWSIVSLKINNMDWSESDSASTCNIQGISLTASHITPGKDVALEAMGDFIWKPSSPATGVRGAMKLSGNLQWTSALDITGLQGNFLLGPCEGMLAGRKLKGMSLRAQVDFSTTSDGKGMLRQASCTIEESGAVLAALNLQGPLDLSRREADLDVTIGPVRSNVLNLLGASRGIDFLDSSARYAGHVTLRSGGDHVHASGRLEASPLNLTMPDLPMGVWRPIQLTAEHVVEVDRVRKSVTLTKLHLDATQMGSPWIQATLNKSMTLSWAENASTGSASPAFVNFQLFPTDLVPWKPFLGLPQDTTLQSGKLSAQATLSATEGGRMLILNGHFLAANVALTGSSVILKDAAGSLDGVVQIKALREVQVTPSAIRLSEKGISLLSGTLMGDLDLRSQGGSGSLVLDSSLPALLAVKPVEGLTLKTGNLKGRVDWTLASASRWSCKTDIAAAPLDLTWKSIRYPQTSISFRGNANWTSPRFKVENATIRIGMDGKPAGSWTGTISGLTDMSSYESDFTFQDFQESSLAPVLAGAFPRGTLRSMDLSGKAHIRHQNGNYDIQAAMDLRKFVFDNSVVGGLPPLDARIALDLNQSPDRISTLRSASIEWTPSEGRKNLVKLSGIVSPTAANLTIHSPSLDVTPWYDRLFPAYKSSSTSALPDPTLSPSVSSVSSGGSTPILPPPRALILNISADSLRLRELVFTKLQIPYTDKDGVQKIDLASATMGGAPVTLSFQRDWTALKPLIRFDFLTDAMPLEAWVASFHPSLKSMVSGKLHLKAIGTTSGNTWQEMGPSLDGIIELAMRNADLEKLPSIKQGLAQLGKFLDSQPIIEADIDRIDASGKISMGRLTTENLHIGGDMVEATLRGSLTWDQRLDMEATFKAKRDALKKSSLFTTSALDQLTGKQDGWSKLPGAAKVGGTLEQPVFQFDKARMFGDILKNAGGNILMDILRGKPAQDPNAQQNQQPPQQNQNPLENLFKGLFK